MPPVLGDRVRLAGGYRNQVWKVRAADGWVIEKNYSEDPGLPNPLYPNLPAQEAAAMRHLFPYGLAAEVVSYRPAGEGVRAQLVYRFLEGSGWARGVADVAEMLCRVHHAGVPRGARRLHRSGAQALAHADAMVADTRDRGLKARMLAARPSGVPADVVRTVALVHTDCGPGNILRTADGLVLIDWQCPGAGDAVEDVACFSSPAMQLLYDRAPLTAATRRRFLQAYEAADDRGSVERYAAHGAGWHYRIAAYCAWRIPHTRRRQPEVAAGYARALEAELEFLEGWGS